MRQSILVLYSRLIRIPVLGHLIAFPVRGFKRVVGMPPPSSVDRMDMLQRAVASSRSRIDAQESEIAELHRLLAVQRQTLAQLITVVELRESQIEAGHANGASYNGNGSMNGGGLA